MIDLMVGSKRRWKTVHIPLQADEYKSEARVAALTKDGILQLSMMVDLMIEGIDFHCSPVY